MAFSLTNFLSSAFSGVTSSINNTAGKLGLGYLIPVDAPKATSFDTTTVAVAKAIDNVGSVTGALATNATTDDAKPKLSGTYLPLTTVSIIDNGKIIGKTTTDKTGAWTFTPTFAMVDGVHKITLQSTNATGGVVELAKTFSLNVVAQASVPKILSIDDNVGSQTGKIVSGKATDDTTPQVSGTAQPNQTIKIFDHYKLVGSTTSDVNGKWSFTMPDIVKGSHNVTAQAVSKTGEESAQSANYSFNLAAPVTTTPNITSIKDDAGKFTGLVNRGSTTDDTTPTLTGQCKAGETVNVYDNNVLLGSTKANASGQWSFTPTKNLGAGLHDLTVAQSHDGVEGPKTASYSFTVAPPVELAKPVIKSVSDNVGLSVGLISNGGTTDDATPTFKGSTSAKATVVLMDESRVYIKAPDLLRDNVGIAVADDQGNWTITTNLSEGSHKLVAYTTNLFGESSVQSTAFNVTVDLPNTIL